MAAFTFRDKGTGSVAGTGATVDLTGDTVDVAAGNLILVGVKWEAGSGTSISSITDSIGNTYTLGTLRNNSGTNGEPHGQFGYCLSSIGANAVNNITVTFSAATPTFKHLCALSITTTSPVVFDVEQFGEGTTGTDPVTGTFSTVNAEEYTAMLICEFSDQTYSAPLISGNTPTLRASASTAGQTVLWDFVTSSSISSGTATVHQTVSTRWTLLVIAFRAISAVRVPLRYTLRPQ